MPQKERLIDRRNFLKASAAGTLSSAFVHKLGSGVFAGNTIPPEDPGHSAAWQPLTTYRGANLNEIAFPLGGIGTGSVSLGGRGNLRDWEIMNRPSKGYRPEFAFFTLRTEAPGQRADTRVIEGIFGPPYQGWSGLGDATAGMPRFREVVFHAAYPFARLEFSDPEVPAEVSLQCFNPLVPHDPDSSGLPVAVFRFSIKNTSAAPLRIGIAGSLTNFIGNDGVDKFSDVKYHNEFKEDRNLSGLFYSASFEPKNAPQNGTIVLATDAPDISFRRHWARSSWRNDLLSFWDDFSVDGRLTDPPEEESQSYTGSIAGGDEIPAGETKNFTFYLVWHFPNRSVKGCGWSQWEGENDAGAGLIGNYYTTRYADAWDAAVKIIPVLPELEKKSAEFIVAVSSSTVPQPLKEAILNNLSTLRTQNCFRLPDGHFFGFEGTTDKSGCCYGSCTHVWNYETMTAFIFPQIALLQREVEFEYSTFDSGAMDFRTRLPLRKAGGKPWGVAADGQMGCIMKLYREWQLSGDNEFLKKHWNNAKKALAYAWIPGGWDADRDGVMEGVQHNTYDVEFFGPNPMMTVWYLGALICAEKMAIAAGDTPFVGECRKLFESGSAWVDGNLFNGEYYIQQVRPVNDLSQVPREQLIGMGTKNTHDPDFQVGTGCLVDHLTGQYMAHINGIGHLLNKENVRKAAESIFKYNFKTDLFNHFNNMRTFALNDENALLICSWPKGGRPRVPFPYWSEVMTGFEYQAAALMIYEGLVEEGLAVIKGIRARYDGAKRNPWDEAECGHHYARAMACYSSLLALSGFHASNIDKTLTFNPVIRRQDFVTFWSNSSGWGIYKQKRTGTQMAAGIELTGGVISLGALILGVDREDGHSGAVNAAINGTRIDANCTIEKNVARIAFDRGMSMKAGDFLDVYLG